ncbi:Transposon TX1 uncharacterized 149 kDa protein [Linum perenne]
MDPAKSPGPDGLSPAFFQHFKTDFGDEIVDQCIRWIDSGELPSEVHNTDIVLIPKLDAPVTMKDLRPISLCNVLYRIVSKALANRLRRCIERLVEHEQYAFIQGRLITDNIMIAYELLHIMKRRQYPKVALKIDISKAFDRVEWSYLESVM